MTAKTLDQEVSKLNDGLVSMGAKGTGNLQVISTATDIGQYIPALGDNLVRNLANIYAVKSAYENLLSNLVSHDEKAIRSSEVKDLVKDFLEFKKYYTIIKDRINFPEKIDKWCNYFEPFGNVDSHEDYVSDTLKKRLQDIVKTNFTEIEKVFQDPYTKFQKDEYIESALFMQELIRDVYTIDGAKLVPVARALASELFKMFKVEKDFWHFGSLSAEDFIREIEKLDKFLTENENVEYDLRDTGFKYLKSPIPKRSFFEKILGKGNANGSNGTTWPG